jgi:hypothetical protein
MSNYLFPPTRLTPLERQIVLKANFSHNISTDPHPLRDLRGVKVWVFFQQAPNLRGAICA